jgi:hypothetical protein
MSTDGVNPDVLQFSGAVIVYRLFDVGYAIDMTRALETLAASAPERARPERGEAQALQIRNPPISVPLGTADLLVEGELHHAELSARIFDFGVVSLRVRVNVPDRLSWPAFSRFGVAVNQHDALNPIIDPCLHELMARILSAIERPVLASVREDYTVFRITRAEFATGVAARHDALGALDVAPLLLGESRPLSDEARRELLPHRFSYYGDDLAILTWESALIAEPGEHDTDVQYLLEFANAQLLELRYYDAILDGELPQMYDAIAAARRKWAIFPGRRFAALLARLQAVVADTTEVVEQVENALKVTDDVYLARVYSAALEIFRGRAWRAGIDRKLSILRETYAMLNDEAQASRSETLEIAIVILIVAEIVMALVRGH